MFPAASQSTDKADPEDSPDSLAGVETPASAPDPPAPPDISNDYSHLSEPSQSFDMSRLTDDSQVLAAAQPSGAAASAGGSQLQSSPGGVLDSQGYIASGDASSTCPSGGTSLLLSDLNLSEDEDEDDESFFEVFESLGSIIDPSLSVQFVRPAKAQRKKIRRRAPAKLSSTDVPPLRRATAPNLIAPRRSSATPGAHPDAADVPRNLSEQE